MNFDIHTLSKLAFRHMHAIYRWGWRPPLESYGTSLKNFFFVPNPIEYQTLESLRARRTSDTLFILASGPTLGTLTEAQRAHVQEHDSFGFNYSFLYPIVPTYYQCSYETKNWKPSFYSDLFARCRDAYKDTVFFLIDKAVGVCLGHPRFAPLFFADAPKLYIHKQPPSISMAEKRDFDASDFARTFYYRGSMTLILHHVVQLGYKNIVLIGVDPGSKYHFYSDYPEMERVEAIHRKNFIVPGDKEGPFEYMKPKPGRPQPMDVYLYAAEKYLREEKGTQLYTWSSNNLLYPRIPAYTE